jgi:hypothetical protein
MAREILAELRNHFGDKMLRTTVNFNTKLKEAASFGQPIFEYDPASKGRSDFRSLAEEVVGCDTKQQRHEIVNSLSSQLEAISATADELLKLSKQPMPPKQATAKREIKEVAAPKVEKQQVAALDSKLSDYYGVNQINEAIVFVTLYPRASSVQVAGDFNNWQPVATPMEKVGDSSGVWQTKMNLPPGRYRYRLVVDGQWQQDPYNHHTELNQFGEFNSIVEVK